MAKIQSKPTRLWFIDRGYTKADPAHVRGSVIWLHPHTNDVLNQYGQKMVLSIVPYEKFLKGSAKYLKLPIQCGNILLARLKYLTFIGDIPEGYTIDHIDGNTLNNDIRNLRAVPDAINRRDGGFMRKLRNHGINVALFQGIILEGYERMAKFKATHTAWQYERLTRAELLQIFLGDHYRIDPSLNGAAAEPSKYYDMFVEKDYPPLPT